MKFTTQRMPDGGGTTRYVLVLDDYDLATAPLDATDRLVINTPLSEDTPVADALQSLQIIAFRIEQANARLHAEAGSPPAPSSPVEVDTRRARVGPTSEKEVQIRQTDNG